MFSETSSFYYSEGGDLTNTVQRQRSQSAPDPSEPPWTRADDRFFWNKHMLQDLITSGVSFTRVHVHVDFLTLKLKCSYVLQRIEILSLQYYRLIQ